MTATDTVNASNFRLCKVYYAAPLNVNYHSPVLKAELNRRFGANALPVCQGMIAEDNATALGLLVVGAAAMAPRPAPVYDVPRPAEAPMAAPAPSVPPPARTSVNCNSNVLGNAVYTHCQ